LAQLSATVHGFVQGVNFRYYTVRRARELGVNGYVRNYWDGTVEVVAEGRRDSLEDLLAWLHRGPSSAVVDHVEAAWGEFADEFRSFEVRY
jgi:acylphosphatase